MDGIQANAAKSTICLEILRGVAKHRVRPISSPVFLIGSAPDCDLVLADCSFPEIHSYLLITHHATAPEVVLHRVAGPSVTVQGRTAETIDVPDGGMIRAGGYLFQLHHDVRRVRLPVIQSLIHDVAIVFDRPELQIFRDSA